MLYGLQSVLINITIFTFALHTFSTLIKTSSSVLQFEQPIILYYSGLIFLAHTDFQCLQCLFFASPNE